MVEGFRNARIEGYKTTRLIMFTMVKLHGDPKRSPKSPEELWQLPGDDTDGRMSEDEMAELFKNLPKE